MSIAPAVIAAYDAGLCTIPTRTDGSKAPFGEWRAYQSERPPRMQVAKWFASEHPGVGVVCGAVSGNLTMIELEGRAVRLGLARRVSAYATIAAGPTLDGWRKITQGLVESTPSGGLHMYYRTNEPALPNTRLASTAEREVLIETRGEGGFSVMAPSHGPTHASGNPWVVVVGSVEGIPTLTAAESEAVFKMCATFDEAAPFTPKPAPPREHKLTVPTFNGSALGASWMDDVETHLERVTDMAALLVEYGWRHDHDAGGRSYWTRPDKPEGVSGVINESSRLVVFSTSTPFAPYDGRRAPSFGLLDVIATYEHGGDRKAAAHRIAQEAGIFDARDDTGFGALKRSVPPERHVRIGPHGPVFGATGDETPDGGVLPPEFWQGHVTLEAIRAAAMARTVAPTALLHVCLARVAAIAPFTIAIPPIVGSVGNLSYLAAVVGPSGAGKSSMVGVASELFPAPPHVLDNLPIGSGEGLADVLFEYVNELDAEGKRQRVRRQTKHNAFVYVDEGQTLTALATRGGSTLMTTLRSAYSAMTLGNTNASDERRRIVPAGRSVFGVVVSIQPAALGPLFDEVEYGTPQRFVYVEASDTVLRGAGSNPTDTLAPIAWRAPTEGPRATFAGFTRLLLRYPDYVVKGTREERAAVASRDLELDPFDTHANLTRLKVAGLLAVLGGTVEVGDGEWTRAGMVMSASNVVRDRARAGVAQDAERAEVASSRRAGMRAVTADNMLTIERTERAALAIARKVAEAGEMGGLTVAALRRSFSSSSPHRAHLDDGLHAAIARGWVVETREAQSGIGNNDKRMLRPGTVTP